MAITEQVDIRSNKKLMVLGIVTIVIAAAVGVGGSLWLKQHDRPSQASATDCALAQKIIDGAQKLPQDKAAATKWHLDMHNLRKAKMRDGYLSATISRYEDWAADKVRGQGAAPTKQELDEVADTANSHCASAKRTLVFPPLAS
ncbi:hypothetical protein ACIBAC_42505 [Streptomyces sp. NPDC051362]|uniref:hypothetical protein n=1 Tax=Streptomyces sp. NPDC051362 TaxID=3365651 RepID=UPI00379B18B8